MTSGQAKERKYGIKCLNSFYLKIIAVITMTTDHIGAVLLPQYLILRAIGRIAFPIYCFLLVNGFLHTGNLKKYIGRLAVFALISEVFFDKVFFGRFIYMKAQNVFFTLLIGIVMLSCIEWLRRNQYKNPGLRVISGVLEGIIVILACMTAYILCTDYSFFGIFMMYGFYSLRYNRIMLGFFQAFINMGMMGDIQSFACTALIPIYLYNGEKGNTDYKWWFYIYYPLHLLVIGIIKAAI